MSGSDSHARSVSSLLQHSLPTLLREQGVDHVDVLPQRQGNSGGVPSEGSPNDEAREGLRNLDDDEEQDTGGLSVLPILYEIPLSSPEPSDDDSDGYVSEMYASSDGGSWVIITSADLDSDVDNGHRIRHRRNRRTRRSPANVLRFDDRDALVLPAEAVDSDQGQSIFADYEVPDFDGRHHEAYRFEVEHPNVAAAIRVMHGLSHAHRVNNLGRAIPSHARTIAVNTYQHVADVSGPIVQTFAEASVNTIHNLNGAVVDSVLPAVRDAMDSGVARLPGIVGGAQAQGERIGQRLEGVRRNLAPWAELGVQYTSALAGRGSGPDGRRRQPPWR